MSKKKRFVPANKNVTVSDRSIFFTDLSFMPTDAKLSPLWMAQSIFHAKMNAIQFETTKKVQQYRKLSRLEIDKQTYIEMIDPKTPTGGGGKATYFASDFQDIPIGVHLDNIVRAKLDKIGFANKLQVNEIDKFAKTQRQKDKDRIIYQSYFRDLINHVREELGGDKSGFPPIMPSESPYEYAKRLAGDNVDKSIDDISRLIDQIKLQIKDEQDFALYERYVYKGDIERAFELGIEHYLINQNKWRLKSELFIDDLKNFNKYCGEYYTDNTTGRKVIGYISPDWLWTSPFVELDGADILYYFYEKFVTFAEFVRMFGTKMTNEQLKEVFLLNKMTGSGGHNLDWNDNWQGSKVYNNAMIKIGKFSVLTQEANRFAEEYVNNDIPAWTPQNFDWTPDPESEVEKQKIYNVWYSCWYVPQPTSTWYQTNNTPTSWQWQAKYIFNIEKNTDMYRYGVDRRYAKSDLVLWKDTRPSFTDVKEAFMPKIRTTWHKFQNCIVQDTNAIVTDWDFIYGMLNAADESNKTNPADPDKPTGGNGLDAAMEQWKMLKQGGFAFMKFRDKNGNIPQGLDPSKWFVKIDSGHLEKAEKYLQVIIQQYEMMKMALAQSDVTEGQLPQARTPVEGIKASVEAANNAMWFLEKPVREMLIMFGERTVQFILCMVKEREKYGYEDRWNEFSDVIGLANALMVEGIEDLDPEDIGLTVSLEDVTAMQEYVFAMANEMVKNKEVSREGAMLAIETNRLNYKYALALLLMEGKRKEREDAAKADYAFQQQQALQDKQLQIALALKGADTQGKLQEIDADGKVRSILQSQLNSEKHQTMTAQKSQLLNNKLTELEKKSELKKEEKAQEPLNVS